MSNNKPEVGRTWADLVGENPKLIRILFAVFISVIVVFFILGGNLKLNNFEIGFKASDREEGLHAKEDSFSNIKDLEINTSISSSSNQPQDFEKKSTLPGDEFIVIIKVNSDMEDGKIFVDEKRVTPFEDNLISKKIKILRREQSYNIRIVSDSSNKSCEEDITISQNNQIIYLCDF